MWAGVVAPADEIGARYCENCHVGNIVPDDAAITVVSEGVRAYAVDPTNAEALWKKSEEMVGEGWRVFLDVGFQPRNKKLATVMK